MPQLRIATRASQLALWQANHVADLIREARPDVDVELVEVTTTGDQDQQEALRTFGGVGVFTREVQRAVLDKQADLAVHSLKDLPTELVEGLHLAGVPERAPIYDALILPDGSNQETPDNPLDILPEKARIGTGSVRRQAQLLHARPDLQLLEIRGNLDTRLKKLDEGESDAIVLAQAGLERLGWADRITALLQPPMMYPAVSQGALGLECRHDDELATAILQQLTDPVTHARIIAERTLLASLRAGCHAPLGVLTSLADEQLTLEAVVLSVDGKERIHTTHSLPVTQPVELGEAVATALQKLGATRLIDTE